ncbi:response regulator [Sabulicella glaciei]|uniref:Response regulator n=1 Tax=Sabulicella glaciei TaxID=2984948 RepID=A0ABT3NRD1_9PROT|nr:response regulator [Roseococcus sp. MDT2-1-1]MCW8084721.1 response regulator [Roseococcus sp. MDT2-1-1]
MVRVLLAEDEALLALFFQDELEACGCEVVWAPNGRKALEQAEQGVGFDVLVTDLNMPHMRGEELIRRLRRTWPRLPVVVVTGTPPPEGAAGLNAEGDGPLLLLVKPVLPAAILKALVAMGVAVGRLKREGGRCSEGQP